MAALVDMATGIPDDVDDLTDTTPQPGSSDSSTFTTIKTYLGIALELDVGEGGTALDEWGLLM